MLLANNKFQGAYSPPFSEVAVVVEAAMLVEVLSHKFFFVFLPLTVEAYLILSNRFFFLSVTVFLRRLRER